MTQSVKNIDHVMLIARDLERVKSLYERMGFYVTPLTFHPHGTGNHLIMFGNTFVELLGVVEPEKLDERSKSAQAFLQVREGIAAIALPSGDARRDREALAERGLDPSDVYSFERPVRLPDGRQINAVVDTVWAPDTSAPLVLPFLSQQHVPEAIWVPEWQHHANSAVGITSLTIVADEPSGGIETLLSRFLNKNSTDVRDGARLFDLGEGAVQVLSPQYFEAAYSINAEPLRPYIACMSIQVTELDRLAACLEEGNVPFDRMEKSIRLRPCDAGGVLLEFTV